MNSQTCETCRYVNYTRKMETGVSNISCGNPELTQTVPTIDAILRLPFNPPLLTFSCNRWAARKLDLGVIS